MGFSGRFRKCFGTRFDLFVDLVCDPTIAQAKLPSLYIVPSERLAYD